MSIKSKPWLKPLILLGVIAAIFLGLRAADVDFSGVTVESMKAKIESFGIWGPVVYIAFYLVRPLILFPAGVLSASAGVIWGLTGVLYVLIAAYIQAIAEFLIARYAARDWVASKIGGRVEHLDRAIERRGFLTVLLIRLVPNLPWDVQNLGLGITKVKLRDYVIATVIGIIPGTFAFVYLGSSFIDVVTNPKNFWKVLVAAAIFGGVYLLQAKLRKKKQEELPESAAGGGDPTQRKGL